MSAFVSFYSNFLWLFSIILTLTLAIAYVRLSRYTKKMKANRPEDIPTAKSGHDPTAI